MKPKQSLILLDMDGVLLHPVGYKESLRATVAHFARMMGFGGDFVPSDEDIAVFESCGMTNEWDSLVMCVAMMMLSALKDAPHVAGETFAETVVALRSEQVALTSVPDYASMAMEVAEHSKYKPPPFRWVLDILLERAPTDTHLILRDLIRNVYELTSPTTRAFQHHTLGSTRFAETYGIPADFETASLLERDRPLLNATNRDRLLAMRSEAGSTMHAVIYTARPSLHPVDARDARNSGPMAKLEVVPEAEIGRELTGLEALPLIATGRLAWLAARNGARSEDYVKPAPLHALAAIGAAVNGGEVAALEAALAFVKTGEVSGPLATLGGTSTRVHVFEDSVGGIRSVSRAVDMLREIGLDVSMEAVGVSAGGRKRDALQKVAWRLVDDINEGLEPLLDGQAEK